MSLLLAHWSYDPFLIAAAIVAIAHEIGLRRLNRRARPAAMRRRRGRSLLFYAGLGVLLIAVESPIDYWSDFYFWVHMIQHLLLIFAAPPLIVASAPWQPLQQAVPARLRHNLMRSVLTGDWSSPLRRLFTLALSPWLAVAGLNVVVVFWHLPGPFDLAARNQEVHIWLMHGSFFVFGMLFFLQLIPSRPIHLRLSPAGQASVIFTTATVMWALAMALSVFSSTSWYPWYWHQEPMYAAYADQQIGAGIMWTSGTIWAIPAMTVALRRMIEQTGKPGLDAIVESLGGVRHRGKLGPAHAFLDARADSLVTAAAGQARQQRSRSSPGARLKDGSPDGRSPGR